MMAFATSTETAPTHTLAPASAMPHLEYLDALRGLAVIGVILVHSAIATHQTGFWYGFSCAGQRGVQLFYVVSAFTLYRSLDMRKSAHAFSFFIRRFFRIAPMFYFAILCNLVLHNGIIQLDGRPLSALELTSAFFFINGFSPRAINSVTPGGWSIAVETTFYAILLPLYSKIKTLQNAVWLFMLLALECMGISWLFALTAKDATHEQFFAFLWFPVEFPVFLLGIITYLFWKQYLRDVSVRLSVASVKTISALGLLASFLIFVGGFPYRDWHLYSSSFMFVPLLLALAMHPWPMLVNRLTVYLGKISYSVYLLHFFVIQYMDHCLTRKSWPINAVHIYRHPYGLFVFYVVALLLTAVLASITWRAIEKPGVAFGRLLIRRFSRPSERSIPIGELMPDF